MKQFDKIKEFVGNMSSGAKKGIAAVIAGIVLFSVVTALLLNHKEYVTLLSGLNETESTEVISKLGEAGVDYQYSNKGEILVPKELADKTRATLALEGYPKSGFTYDTFINNAGLMSTESDKRTFKLYELQNRIGATIRTLEGVESAVVTITPGESQKYVLDNEAKSIPTAYVVVNMSNGGSPSPDQVEAIQRLVAKSVPDMDLGDVAVIDGNGLDVSVVRNDDGLTSQSNDKKTRYEEKVESQVQQKVLNVLESVYGRNNVRVSVKCTADMQRIISEEIGYTAPDTQNNAGYIEKQGNTSESSTEGGTVGGVPGANANTNVTQYNTQGGGNSSYTANSSDTDYALNQKKVQGQSDSGAIVDMSIAVSINSEDWAPLQKNDVISLVGRAAGMDPAVQGEKIAVVNADFYDNKPADKEVVGPGGDDDGTLQKYLPYIIIGLVAALVLVIVLLIIIVRGNKKRKQQALTDADAARNEFVFDPASIPKPPAPAEEDNMDPGNERGMKLKNNVKAFAEENPEISASLLKSWLRGGDDNG